MADRGYPGRGPADPSARGEQVDDHQHELATELARRGLALHRDPDSITINDMLTTLHTSIRRTASPPPFELRH